jgi:hypothetical protein
MQNDTTQNSPAQDDSAQNVNDTALAYMERKYGEKFEYVAPYGDSMTGTHQLLVQCASFPDQPILVRVENYKKSNRVFLDNYVAVKYQEHSVSLIVDCAKQVFGETNVFYTVDKQALSPDLSAEASFDEYLADTRVPLNIMIEAKASKFSSKEQAQELTGLLASHGCDFYLSLVFVQDNDFGATDNKALESKMANGNYAHCAKVTSISGETNIRWLEEE